MQRLAFLLTFVGGTAIASEVQNPAQTVRATSAHDPAGPRERADASSPAQDDATAENGPQIPIPATYQAAFRELDRLTTDEARARFRKEDQRGLIMHHFGIGLWIRNNWIYPEDSPLTRDMRRLGIGDPDDISHTLIQGYWCRLNGGELDLRPMPRGSFHRVCWGRPGSPQTKLCTIDGSPLAAVMSPLTRKDDKHDRLAYVGRCSHGHLWVAYLGEPWRAPTKPELRSMRRADRAMKRRERRRGR